MRIYVDTSFLISLYSPDKNSITAAQVMRSANNIHLVSALSELEGVNALQLRIFRKEISSAQAKSSLRHFEQDLRAGIFQLTRLPDEAFQTAARISRRTTARLGTRTADLLHVAAALELKVDYLYSFDRQQRRLAQTLRLKINRQA